MRFLDAVQRGGRNLRQAKVRTLLTAAALAVGGFTLTLTLAASNGAREYTDRLIRTNFDPQSLIVAKDKTLFENGAVAQGPQPYDESLTNVTGSPIKVKQLTADDIKKIEQTEGVETVLLPYQTEAQYLEGLNGKRYTGSFWALDQYQAYQLTAGERSGPLAEGKVIVPEAFVPLLGYSSASQAVGQPIKIAVKAAKTGQSTVRTFTIQGILSKPDTLADPTTANAVLTSQKDAQSLANIVTGSTPDQDKFVSVNVHIAGDKANIEATKQRLVSAGYAALSIADAQKLINQIINVLQIIILVFGSITLIASFFGVVNTQYISVLERTREIGLMKALGLSRWGVSRLFIIEATWIGFIGAVLGSAGAVAVGTLLNPTITEKINFGSSNLLIFDWRQIGLLVLFLMVVTTIAGLLPARKAARLDPIEALRTE